MNQFFAQLSLLHGWLPAVVQGLALLALISAIEWRRRRFRRRTLPIALVVGALVTALCYWYIVSLETPVGPEPAIS